MCVDNSCLLLIPNVSFGQRRVESSINIDLLIIILLRSQVYTYYLVLGANRLLRWRFPYRVFPYYNIHSRPPRTGHAAAERFSSRA